MKKAVILASIFIAVFLIYFFSPIHWVFNDTISFDEGIRLVGLEPNTKDIYVIHEDGNPLDSSYQLSKVNGNTFTVTKKINLPDDISPIAIHPSSKQIIFREAESENLMVFNFLSEIITESEFPDDARSILVDTIYDKLIFVYEDRENNLVTVQAVNATDMQVLEEIQVIVENLNLIFNPSETVFFIYDIDTNIIREYDIKTFEEKSQIELAVFDIDFIQRLMKISDSQYVLMKSNQLVVIDLNESKIVSTFGFNQWADRMLFQNNLVYSLVTELREPLKPKVLLTVIDPLVGETVNEAETNTAGRQVMSYPHSDRLYVINGMGSISVFDTNLTLQEKNFRYSIDLGLAILLAWIFFLLNSRKYFQQSNQITYGIITLSLSVFVLWVFWLIFTGFDEFSGIIPVILISYIAAYVILVFFRFERIRDFVYYTRKEQIIRYFSHEGRKRGTVARMFVISFLVTVPTVYMIAVSPVSFVFETLPIDELSITKQLISEDVSSRTLLQFLTVLFGQFGYEYPLWIMFSIGTLWVFLLRLVRKEETVNRKNDDGAIKSKGTRVFLLYLYISYAVFIIQEIFGRDVFFDSSRFVFVQNFIALLFYSAVYSLILSILFVLLQRTLFSKQEVKRIDDNNIKLN